MAGIKRWTGSAWEDVADIKRWTGSAWESINAVSRWSGSAWEQIWPSFTVTLSGETVTDYHSPLPGTATAGIRFNTDGTVDKLVDGAYSQIDSGTDWIIPNVDADSTFDVRCTNITSGSWTSEAAAEDTWISLSANREWYVFTNGIPSTQACTCTFEIRKDGGAVLDSATYTCTATVEN
jgi:hypothetical protein